MAQGAPHAFGTKIRACREERGWSQARLAGAVAGVNESYVSRIETGSSPPPSRDVVIALASALDLPILDLLVLAGRDVPADHVKPPKGTRPTVEAAIMSDPLLREVERQTLIRVYRSYVEGRQ